MKHTFLLFGLLLMAAVLPGQTVLLNVDRNSEQKVSDFGPNLKKFGHLFLKAGLLASADKEGARINYGSSVNLALGFREKYKIGSVYSFGYDIELQFTDYKLKQESGKIFPDTIINNVSERMDYTSLTAGIFNRINFDPNRGNYLGRFLDLGIREEWNVSIRHVTKNDLPDGTRLKNVLTALPYVNRFNTVIFARLGFSRFSVYGSYRITGLYKSSWTYPDLPRFIAGFDIALF